MPARLIRWDQIVSFAAHCKSSLQAVQLAIRSQTVDSQMPRRHRDKPRCYLHFRPRAPYRYNRRPLESYRFTFTANTKVFPFLAQSKRAVWSAKFRSRLCARHAKTEVRRITKFRILFGGMAWARFNCLPASERKHMFTITTDNHLRLRLNHSGRPRWERLL